MMQFATALTKRSSQAGSLSASATASLMSKSTSASARAACRRRRHRHRGCGGESASSRPGSSRPPAAAARRHRRRRAGPGGGVADGSGGDERGLRRLDRLELGRRLHGAVMIDPRDQSALAAPSPAGAPVDKWSAPASEQGGPAGWIVRRLLDPEQRLDLGRVDPPVTAIDRAARFERPRQTRPDRFTRDSTSSLPSARSCSTGAR